MKFYEGHTLRLSNRQSSVDRFFPILGVEEFVIPRSRQMPDRSSLGLILVAI